MDDSAAGQLRQLTRVGRTWLQRGLTRAQYDYLRMDPCVYCGRLDVGAMTIEHIEPRAFRGGAGGDWRNKATACAPCNSRRAATPLLVWLLALAIDGSAPAAARRVDRWRLALARQHGIRIYPQSRSR